MTFNIHVSTVRRNNFTVDLSKQSMMCCSASLFIVVTLIASVCGCGHKSATSHAVASPTSIPDVTFCEMVTKPDEFYRKLIRLHALLVRESMHGPVLGGAKGTPCATRDNVTWPELSNDQWAEVVRAGDAASYDIVAVGRFSRYAPSGGSDLWRDRASFQFEVTSFDKIEPRF
jgi:hypothetical protein